MIRVLHTIDTTGPGGAETVFANLTKGLDPEWFESFAAITGPGWVCDELRRNGLEPIFVQARGGFNFTYLKELARIVREHKIDVIQSHLLGSNLYCSLVGLICRIPVISTFHGFVDSSSKDRLMPFKSRIINLGSRKIVFVSDGLRKHFIQEYGFSSTKAITIYNGVDTSIFKPQRADGIRNELGLSREHFLIGAVGNIRPAKGYETFLRAARIINERYPETRFIVAGEGSGDLYDSLLNLRKKLNLEKKFFFIGFRDNPEVTFNNLDLFVLPSVSEGFSIATVEAMACGIPVVVTRSGGPEEIVVNGENGITVECDENKIADAIVRQIQDKRKMQEISKFATTNTIPKYSLKTIIEKYGKQYMEAFDA